MKAEKLLDSDDPFVKSLEEKKKQYADYTDAINSSDATLAGSAKQAFADLLAEGSSYVDMLRRKIDTLNGLKIKGELTIEGQKQLDILNAALNKEQGTAKSVGAAFKEHFADIGSSISFVSSCFGSVTNGIKKMGISMDEETEAILGDIGGMLDGASQIATGHSHRQPVKHYSRIHRLFVVSLSTYSTAATARPKSPLRSTKKPLPGWDVPIQHWNTP